MRLPDGCRNLRPALSDVNEILGMIERADGKPFAKAGAFQTEEQYIGVLTDAGFEFDHVQARMSRPVTGDEQPPAPVPGYSLHPLTRGGAARRRRRLARGVRRPARLRGDAEFAGG